jgi:hypothetical protein
MATDAQPNPHGPVSAEAQLDREIEMVRGAIRMVAVGASPRMTVAGIRFGEAVIRIVKPIATSADITVEPIWRADDSGCDVLVYPTLHA